ncbi:hypothetical protein J437_LFUL013198 [Ladona fulva]|uniref:Uncharacterized protein n=1 Tax=Ladona fulva TaxID=123851 RepID=A0A8K0KI02_LADFU|nr:hypothetical protein J437_LFUL013198 [Ladona fulva]
MYLKANETDCSKCTERQRTGIEKVIEYLSEQKKEQWMELLQKIDPEGKERAKYTLGVRNGYSPYA